VGNALMVNPALSSGPPTMFYCGNTAGNAVVAEIIRKFGWERAGMGTAAAARPIEALCQLCCIPGFLRNEWRYAFRLIRS
jgi:predicted dinucleotide-binding enzyme